MRGYSTPGATKLVSPFPKSSNRTDKQSLQDRCQALAGRHATVDDVMFRCLRRWHAATALVTQTIVYVEIAVIS